MSARQDIVMYLQVSGGFNLNPTLSREVTMQMKVLPKKLRTNKANKDFSLHFDVKPYLVRIIDFIPLTIRIPFFTYFVTFELPSPKKRMCACEINSTRECKKITTI